LTKKGKGYLKAEKNPGLFHGVEPFDITTGKPINIKKNDTYTNVFGRTITEMAAENDKIIAITAAMQANTGLDDFAGKFPGRLFDVGIAEGYASVFAAAMAKDGFSPIIAVYSTFLQRAYDQIVHDICIEKLPVVFSIDRAGAVGGDGQTHQGLFDIALLSHIPNMTVMAPKNGQELSDMLRFAPSLGSPVSVRYPKGEVSKVPYESNNPIEYGKSEKIFNGEKIALVSLGAMTDTAYEVCLRLKETGLSPTLINARFAKPIDTEMVEKLGNYEYIFTLEDGVLNGGFGSILLRELNKKDFKMPAFHSFGFPDVFPSHGTVAEIMKIYNLDAESIFETVMSKIDSKDTTKDEQ
jgi:1-deoxy-D-xylulose-5-phosphate synthase